MEIYLSLFGLFIATLGGGLLFNILERPVKNSINFFLIFSGAFLLGITILKLIPHVFEIAAKPAIFILLGFLIQLGLESLSKGIEHGHLHLAERSRQFPWTITLGLAIHAFIEGLPLSHAFDMQSGVNNALFFGILIHKIPAAFVLLAVASSYGFSRFQAFSLLAIFALMTPLGTLASKGLLAQPDLHENAYLKGILGVVVGAFLHISTTILFEAQDKHQFTAPQILAVLLGLGISLFALI